MIDSAIRSKGIGASEIASIVGLDPHQDSYGLWLEKRGVVSRQPETPRMRAGKKVEKVIAELYAEETCRDFRIPESTKLKEGPEVIWMDTTYPGQHPFQVFTPDAYVDGPDPKLFGLDCKNVALDQQRHWGEPGTDEIPQHYLTQCHWSMSASGLNRWDVAAFFGGWDLRLYTVHKDEKIEGVLLEAAEQWWKRYMIDGREPSISDSETCSRYLRERFPRNSLNMRPATAEETFNFSTLRRLRDSVYAIVKNKDDLEAWFKLQIGDNDGIQFTDGEKLTYKLCKDTTGTDWEAVSKDLLAMICSKVKALHGHADALLADIVSRHEITVKKGSRRFLTTFAKESAA